MLDFYSVVDGLKQRLKFKAFREGPVGPDAIFSAVHIEMVADSDGVLFDPKSCKHKFFYSNTISGFIEQDMAIDPVTGVVRVKNYQKVSNTLVNESAWMISTDIEPGILSFNVNTSGNPIVAVL